MNRRSLIKGLFGGAAAAVIAPELLLPKRSYFIYGSGLHVGERYLAINEILEAQRAFNEIRARYSLALSRALHSRMLLGDD